MWREVLDFITQNDEAIQAISSAVSALAAFGSLVVALFLMKQIGLQKKQLQEQERWNKLNAGFTYFNDEIYYRLEDKVFDALKKLNINWREKDALTPDIIGKLTNPACEDTDNARIAISRLLSFLEGYAIAASGAKPVINQGIARQMYGEYMIMWFEFFEPLIKAIGAKRADTSNRVLFDKLEGLYKKWRPKPA